jgi:hypothetical protein
MLRTDLEPGSEAAQLLGCICDNQSGRPAGTPIRVEKLCPIHGLAEFKAAMDQEQVGGEDA